MRIIVYLLLFSAVQYATAQSGVTWSQTIPVATSQYGNMHPRVVCNGLGNPVVLWGNSNTQGVYLSRWTGLNFSNPVKLNPDTIPVFAASWAGPDIAAHGDTVYVVFKETPEDVNGIYLLRSFDGGVNFSAPVRVDAIADSISRFPAITADEGGNPLVAFMKFNPGWTNPRYVLSKSANTGNTFDADVPASGFSGGVVCDCCPATVISSAATTAVLYRDNLNNLRNNWAGVSFNGGLGFANGMAIDDTDWVVNACPASGPDGVIISDTLYSVFMSAASGKTLCYRSSSSLGNLQLATNEALTGNFTGLSQQNYPRIAAAGNAVAIVWKQVVNGSSQLAVQFTDNIANGFPAGYDVLVANNVANADVSFSNGKVYVVWEDMSSGNVKYKSGTYSISGLQATTALETGLKIYPNPTKDAVLHLLFEENISSELGFEVFNQQGQCQISGKKQLNDKILELDISGLQRGMYWIRINSENQIFIQKLIRS